MASVNKVILIGNLGADPETRYLPSGEAVTNIRVATTDRWKDKASGEMKESTEWHRVAFFGRLAEIAGASYRALKLPPDTEPGPRTWPAPPGAIGTLLRSTLPTGCAGV